MEGQTAAPISHERDINRAIRYLETVQDDHYIEGGANTEINSVVLARIGKNVRTMKNILLFWFILFGLAAIPYLLIPLRLGGVLR